MATTTKTPAVKVQPAAKQETKPLSKNKQLVLETLSKAKDGLTRSQLAEKTGIAKGWSKMLGAVTKGDPAEGTLEGDGLVKSSEVEGVSGLVYTLTEKGRKALADSKKAAKETK